MHLHHLTRDLDEVELLRARRRQPREARELGHDVRDAGDLVEDRARRLVEVRVELRVLARAQAAQRLDRGADWRERVLDLVGDAARDLAPRGHAARRGQAAARRLEVDEHRVERLRELGDLARASHAQRPRLAAGDLARLGRELGDRAAEAPGEQHREEERDGRRREAPRRPSSGRFAPGFARGLAFDLLTTTTALAPDASRRAQLA